jgi:menaquinone-dependent protoporphyrinogen oxidase
MERAAAEYEGGSLVKALVTVSSKHGATKEIGEAIAETLRSAGIYVAVVEPEHVDSLIGYDAVVVGSALYMGRWMAPAREFVQRNAVALGRLPVWLFASGPIIGTLNAPSDGPDTAEGRKLQELVGAREAKVFAGELKKESLGFVEKQIVKMVKSPWGDYRPWEEIRAWAESIAKELNAVPAG